MTDNGTVEGAKNGRELYDIEKDLEQRQNMAAQFSDTVSALQKEYEKWWQENSPQK